VVVLAAVNAIGMTLLFPARQTPILAINGIEGAIGLGATALALRRPRLPPLPLAAGLALSAVVTVLHLLVFVPESRATSFMLLVLIPLAAALFMPWSVTFHAGWLLAGATALAAFTIAPAGAAVPTADWIGAWLVLAISGLASLVGCVGATDLRRRAFGRRMELRRAYVALLAREAELERLNVRLARATRMDPLTGLGNRLGLNDELAKATARSRRYGNDCAVVLFDLDRFKDYNDSLGHLAGDAALQAVAAALRASARVADMVCRFGGEEFVVLMPEQTLAGAEQAAQRLRGAVEDLGLRYPTGGGSRPLTISAGVALLGRTAAQDPDEVVRAADAALYRAKRSGRNRVAITSNRAGRSDIGRPAKLPGHRSIDATRRQDGWPRLIAFRGGPGQTSRP
jgi:diguanylate cyclase (GGDEF)-like protein